MRGQDGVGTSAQEQARRADGQPCRFAAENRSPRKQLLLGVSGHRCIVCIRHTILKGSPSFCPSSQNLQMASGLHGIKKVGW